MGLDAATLGKGAGENLTLTDASVTWRLKEQPRQWQVEALGLWQRNDCRGVIAVATGAGKTIFAYMCMLAVLERNAAAQVVIIVPTLALMDQWVVGLQEDLGVPDSEISTFSGRGKPQPRRVNLLVINTARKLAEEISAAAPTFLIVDECHRAAGPVNARALDGTHLATLGLSATPEGTYDDAFEERIAPKLGRIIFRYDYSDARRDGVIVPFALINVRVPLTSAEQDEYDRLTRQVSKYSKQLRTGDDVGERLKHLLIRRAGVSAAARNRIPVAITLGATMDTVRTIVFHERIAAAEEIASGLRDRGLSVGLYHSRMSEALRYSNLRLFRRGSTDVLVTCRALDEGFNVPEAAVAIIASSTASPRQRIQRLGRILRPAKQKDSARVHTLYATDAEETRLVKEAAAMHDLASVTWMKAAAG